MPPPPRPSNEKGEKRTTPAAAKRFSGYHSGLEKETCPTEATKLTSFRHRFWPWNSNQAPCDTRFRLPKQHKQLITNGKRLPTHEDRRGETARKVDL